MGLSGWGMFVMSLGRLVLAGRPVWGAVYPAGGQWETIGNLRCGSELEGNERCGKSLSLELVMLVW